jgi:hypothetical protein
LINTGDVIQRRAVSTKELCVSREVIVLVDWTFKRENRS